MDLQGIANHEELSARIVFKGGTVLKKVYFPEYRFSEDLDFTLILGETTNEQIFSWFTVVFDNVRRAANIPLAFLEDNEHEDGGINFYIGFVGPLGGLGANKKVKVDISRGENLIQTPVMREVFLPYSDLQRHSLLCYTLEEILVEKLRSVMQRMQARDVYDIWYLLSAEEMDPAFLVGEFREKCIAKELIPAEFHRKLSERLPQYKGRWSGSLKYQIRDLPDFEQVEREVMRSLKAFNP